MNLSKSSFHILHSTFCILSCALCIALAASTNADPVDQSVRAADEPAIAPLAPEPILRWHGKHKRKVFTPPADNPPHVYARVSFATNHAAAGIVVFSAEAIGDYFPPRSSYIFDGRGEILPALGYDRRPKEERHSLAPGETTPWAEITRTLYYGYDNIFSASARLPAGRRLADDAVQSFRVDFSLDGTNVLASLDSAGGRLVVGLVSPARGTVLGDIALSEADLAKARAEVGTTDPKRPRRFTVRFGHSLNPDAMSPAAFSNEVEVMRLSGANDLGELVGGIVDPAHEFEPDYLYRRPPGGYIFTCNHGCICSPDAAGMTNKLLQLVEACAGPLARGRKLIVGTGDEPHYDIRDLTNCQSRVATCRERHGRDFVLDPVDVEEYLATVAYRDGAVAGFYKVANDAARAIHSNLLTSVNVGISLVFEGNAEAPGTDPFTMADADAFGIGQTEDWCNVQRTRQFASYMCDVYRSAYGRHGKDFNMYSIVITPQETAAKAYSEVGHGAKALSFYHYGPHWLNGDNRNRLPGLIAVIRQFCEALADAEEAIHGASVAKGDAALFYSQSCDRLQIVPGWKRDWIERNPYGKDRMCASLMLLHCGVRTDVLSEDDLATRLAPYKFLFATDRNIRRDAAEALVAWMRAGGVLVRTRGALVADDRDRPLPGGMFESAGRVVEMDFSPWVDYVRPAKRFDKKDPCKSHRDFDWGVLDKMKAVLNEAGVTRRVFTDCPLVEASLLENGAKSAIALSNWSTNATLRVAVTLDPAPQGEVRSASGADVAVHREGDRLEAALEIGWGDFLVIEPPKP